MALKEAPDPVIGVCSEIAVAHPFDDVQGRIDTGANEGACRWRRRFVRCGAFDFLMPLVSGDFLGWPILRVCRWEGRWVGRWEDHRACLRALRHRQEAEAHRNPRRVLGS